MFVSARGKCAGVTVEVDQWGWSLGFYPGLKPGQHRSSSAATFGQARKGFRRSMERPAAPIPAGAFDEYRRDRERRAEIRATTPARKAAERNALVANAVRLRRHLR